MKQKEEEEEEDRFLKFFFPSYFMTWSTSRSIRARKRPILPSFEKTLKKTNLVPRDFSLKKWRKESANDSLKDDFIPWMYKHKD